LKLLWWHLQYQQKDLDNTISTTPRKITNGSWSGLRWWWLDSACDPLRPLLVTFLGVFKLVSSKSLLWYQRCHHQSFIISLRSHYFFLFFFFSFLSSLEFVLDNECDPLWPLLVTFLDVVGFISLRSFWWYRDVIIRTSTSKVSFFLSFFLFFFFLSSLFSFEFIPAHFNSFFKISLFSIMTF
jgi:hypothetical protein